VQTAGPAPPEVGADAPVAPPRAIGLSHIAFRLDDEAHLRAAYDDLKARIPPMPLRSCYVR
jgi:hypothetical protein